MKDRQAALESRRAELIAQADSGQNPLRAEDAKQVAAAFADQLEEREIPRVKKVLQMLVNKILVESRSAILPFISLPLVRIMGGWVDLIAKKRLTTNQANFRRIAHLLFDRALAAEGSNPKGDTFEVFLVFLFSQIGFFNVYSHDYVNETEEIDVVLSNGRVGVELPRSSGLLHAGTS